MKRLSTDTLELHGGPGGVVLLFTLGLMGLVVVLAGLWPAWRASNVDPAADVKEGEASIAGRRAPRMGAWLIPAQIAFSLVIVTMAALMGSTVARLLAVDPGFRTSGITLLTADFSPRKQKTGQGKPEKVPACLYLALLDRIQHTAGVEDASISRTYPLEGATYMEDVSSRPDSGGTRTDENLTVLTVTPGYLDVFGIPLLTGRVFTRNDDADTDPVCILNRSAAEYFFPGGNAVGGVVTMETECEGARRWRGWRHAL